MNFRRLVKSMLMAGGIELARQMVEPIYKRQLRRMVHEEAVKQSLEMMRV